MERPTTAYLRALVSGLVSDPSAVKIEESSDDMGVLLSLTIAQQDMGSVIGRQGNTAKAIRTLLRVAGMKEGARVSLKICEPECRIGHPMNRVKVISTKAIKIYLDYDVRK